MRESLFAIAVASVTALGFADPSVAQENADQKLGTVHFETSCNETAQRRFDRAMRYQHSFWYAASKEIYEEYPIHRAICMIQLSFLPWPDTFAAGSAQESP